MATWHYKLFTVIHSVVANNNTINKYLTVKLKSINWFEGVAAIKILKSFQSPRNKVGPYSILSTWHPHFLLPPYICKSQSFPLWECIILLWKKENACCPPLVSMGVANSITLGWYYFYCLVNVLQQKQFSVI